MLDDGGFGAWSMHGAFLLVLAGNDLRAQSIIACQPKEHMNGIRSIVGLVTTLALVSAVPALAADLAADALQVATQAASIPALQQSAAAAAGYQATDVEVKSTAHQITVTVVNSKLNAGLPAGRSNEAAKIMQALERSIAGKVEFGQVMVMHLDYVSRQGTESKIIQGFDFNKAPSGAFVPHLTCDPVSRGQHWVGVESETLAWRSITRCQSLSDRPAPTHYREMIKRVPAPARQRWSAARCAMRARLTTT